ncbi:MAG: SDR family NAD(P)-dependent oxidoreductase [Gammaproteobacteria bacterium]|nr:SDR family NAD(P)-dependent oxidoreductase [Gammaproteobacteria bacterium]
MIIWITGASSGLGRELARQYAEAGHQVCVSARGTDALAELAEECCDMTGTINSFGLDVTDPEQVNSCFEQIKATTGIPNLCVFNAGTHTENPVKGFDRKIYQRLMSINYMGVVNCLQVIIPVYLQQGSGQIAIVSSVAGYRGLPNASAYGASKAALINMCEALQPELAAENIDLRLINPGFVRTPLTDMNEFPMPFLMEVEDAAARMVKGLAGNSFEITFPRRFTWLLKCLCSLPYAVYLRLTRKLLRDV